MRSFRALIRKDLKGYFDQPTGYILIVVFLALLSWSFFRSAFVTSEASLRPLFTVDFAVESPSIPWLLALLVPAATMRLLAEEQRDGTLEILLTQPIQGWVILLAKFTAGLAFVTIAVLSTIGIPLSLMTAGNLDWGAIVAQYIGSIFLAASLVSIGLFTSSLTRNQIVSFILGLFVTLVLMLLGLDAVGVTLPGQFATLLQSLSPVTHFSSIARGVIDLRDVLYFVAIVSTFLSATFLSVRGRTLSHRTIQYRNLQLGTAALIVLSILVGWFGASVKGRLDLTADKVYTLSDGTEQILSGLDDLLTIELYESADPPVQVDLVARDINDFLEDLAGNSGDVTLVRRFLDFQELEQAQRALESAQDAVLNADSEETALAAQTALTSANNAYREAQDTARKAQLAGIEPQQFNVQTPNGLEIKNGFLGLAMTYTDRREVIPFIRSLDGFEYRVATLAYNMLQQDVERKTIAFLTGHGEKPLEENFRELGRLLSQQYNLAELPSDGETPLDLTGVDVLVVAGPTQRMSAQEYEAINAYLQNGGKLLALVDPVFVTPQQMAAFPNQFHFGDFLEPYGILVEDNLVFDLRSNETITLGTVMLPYPYWPRVPTVDRKVAGDVESVLMPWSSSLGITDSQVGNVEVIPLMRTSPFASVDYAYGDVSPESEQLDVTDRQLFESDMGVAIESLEARQNGASAFRLVVVGDSDWLTDPFVNQAQENLALGLNLIDWLAQEENLAEIRSKVITTRNLTFSSPTHRSVVQLANVAGIPIVFIALGIIRYVTRRRKGLRTYIRGE
ncbi:MAG: Gldg family protein [Chloroflexi bacterium]|nr:Gldg family protein [Chloroflexota bacterium]MYC05694.1 ABC transporter permease subunit [Chloroflexota bacterium]